MAKKKRALEVEGATEPESVHALPKKRVKYTEEDAQLATIYNDLADEVQVVRIKAAGELLKKLSINISDQTQLIDVAETRLIRGLCSGRKAARLGFSIALAELFRLKFHAKPRVESQTVHLIPVLRNIVKLTSTEGNVSGQEKRDHALGRRFAFQAILQSDVGLSKHLADDEWQRLVEAIFDLASQKQWLRRECGVMFHDYLTSPKGSEISNDRVLIVMNQLVSYKLAKTSEGVGLWIDVQRHFPDVKLPKDIWHHRNPLSSKERAVLAKVLLETGLDDEPAAKKSGARQSAPSFAWSVILSRFAAEESEGFAKFWKTAVTEALFSSSASTERKALGLQVLTLAIGLATKDMLDTMLESEAVFRSILDQRSSSERYLFDAAKLPLNRLVVLAKQHSPLVPNMVDVLIELYGPNFDQLSKTKTIETIINEANVGDLQELVGKIQERIQNRGDIDQIRADNERRMLADILLNTLRGHRVAEEVFQVSSEDEEPDRLHIWVRSLLSSLVENAYEKAKDSEPSISHGSQTMFQNRLMSCLNCLLDQKIERAVISTKYVVDEIRRVNRDMWKWEDSDRVLSALERAYRVVDGSSAPSTLDTNTTAYHLLFYLCTIQVHNNEPDSVAALEDLTTCYASQKEMDESATMLTELLLSFISKSSAVTRKLAEQVFSAFAPQLTAESLQSLIDVLGQKENLSGQRALFEDQEQDAGTALNGEEVDVEDVSDIELVNGHEVGALASGDEGDDTSSSDSSSEAKEGADPEQEEELAAFDKKLAEALGTNNMGDDSDDDGSDMDDEQMMALEPHLESIFKERQKDTTKKKDQKDAKENIVNFKNRVLDLLTIYVKSQYSSVLALDLVLPLITLIRITKSKGIAEKAFAVLKQYFEACNKNKSFPQLDDNEPCFLLLEAVHSEVKMAGSNLHTNACSRSSLFLSKVFVRQEPENYRRIAMMYAELQSEWYLDPKMKKSLVSVFNEWANWSNSTRKQE